MNLYLNGSKIEIGAELTITNNKTPKYYGGIFRTGKRITIIAVDGTKAAVLPNQIKGIAEIK